MSDVSVNAADLKKIKSFITDMTKHLRTIDDRREDMKAIAASVEEQFGIKKKIINKIARTMYKHNYADLQAENEHFEFLYEAVSESKQPDVSI